MLAIALFMLIFIHALIMSQALIFNKDRKSTAWRWNYCLCSLAIGLGVAAVATYVDVENRDRESGENLSAKYAELHSSLENSRATNLALREELQNKARKMTLTAPGIKYHDVNKVHIIFTNGDEVVKMMPPGEMLIQVKN